MKLPLRFLRIGIIASIFNMISFFSCRAVPYKACVIVPVADLVGQTLHNTSTPTAHAYHTMPFCGGSWQPWLSCKRLHQLLFNETVTVLKETKDEVLVDVPNAFYVTKADKKTICTTYWTLKKNILPIAVLEKKGIKALVLPEPISFSKKAPASNNIVTLTMPFYDRSTGLTFSVGTRFVMAKTQTDTKKNVMVAILDPKSHRVHSVALPHELCITNAPKAPQEKVQLALNLMRSWATFNKGFILYVWGGCSFTQLSPNAHFLEKSITIGTTDSSYFYLPTATGYPKTGFDCSGLILRAFQIVGIPYYFKNTTTIEHFLPALTPQTPLAAGDLIVIPGHVMVVSDIKKNLLIEARSFIHGYGKVQELPLEKVFLGIRTYTELLSAYFDKKSIYRIDKSGMVRDSIATFKLCRLAALFTPEKK